MTTLPPWDTVTGWATAPTSDWGIYAYAARSDIDPNQVNPLLNGSVNPLNMNNGQTVTLTLTIPAWAPSGSYTSVAVYSYPLPQQADFFGTIAAGFTLPLGGMRFDGRWRRLLSSRSLLKR